MFTQTGKSKQFDANARESAGPSLRGSRPFSSLKSVLGGIALLVVVAGLQTGIANAVPGAGVAPPQVVKPAKPARGPVAFRRHALGELIAKKQKHARPISRRLSAAPPATADLTAYDVPVGDQGPVGSCVT